MCALIAMDAQISLVKKYFSSLKKKNLLITRSLSYNIIYNTTHNHKFYQEAGVLLMDCLKATITVRLKKTNCFWQIEYNALNINYSSTKKLNLIKG